MDNTLYLIFGLAIAVMVVIPVSILKKKTNNSQKRSLIKGGGNSQQNGEGNIAISVGTISNTYMTSPVTDNNKDREVSIDQIKSELKVIFVDDKRFNVVDLLKKNGWKQVGYKRDITDIDSIDVREAHVFFLDINGVGLAMGFHNQGMGLCGALKRRYGANKRVVLYSGETTGDIFDADARMADDTLKKDSDLYQFTTLMEQYGKELL